jgi:hypothetical protein
MEHNQVLEHLYKYRVKDNLMLTSENFSIIEVLGKGSIFITGRKHWKHL